MSHDAKATGLPFEVRALAHLLKSEDDSLELLEEALVLLKTLRENAKALVMDELRSYLKKYASALEHASDLEVYRAETGQESLQVPKVPSELVEFVYSLFYNTVDESHEHLWRNITPERAAERLAFRTKQATAVVEGLARLRNVKAVPGGIMLHSIERLYQGTHETDWLSQAKLRTVLTPNKTRALVADLRKHYTPVIPFVASTWLSVHCRDNLEFWKKIKFSGIGPDGKIANELIHCVTGEDTFVDASLVSKEADDAALAAAGEGAAWPFLNTYNMFSAVPGPELVKSEMQAIMTEAWAITEPNDEGVHDSMCAPLFRPPPSADPHKRPPTPYKHAQILIGVGTTSYEDAKIVANSSAKDVVAEKHIFYGDMGMMPRMAGLRENWPKEYSNTLAVPGEFHAHAHAQDGILQLEWVYNVEWLACFFELKGLSKQLVMKEYSLRFHWLMKLFCAALRWLRDLGFTSGEINDFEKLLDKYKKNLPVYAFLGFVFYELAFLWKWKKATQCHDIDFMNYAWRYCLLVYGDTNKSNYKKGTLHMCKVLFDTVPSVQVAVTTYRTVTQSGKPCTGQAQDMLNEKVTRTTNNRCNPMLLTLSFS